MAEVYEAPMAEVVKFEATDVICASGCDPIGAMSGLASDIDDATTM